MFFFFFLLFLPVSNLVLSSFTKAHASPLSTKLCIKQRNRCWKVTSFYDLQSETYSLPQGFRRGFPSHTVCGKSTAHWFRPNKCKLQVCLLTQSHGEIYVLGARTWIVHHDINHTKKCRARKTLSFTCGCVLRNRIQFL